MTWILSDLWNYCAIWKFSTWQPIWETETSCFWTCFTQKVCPIDPSFKPDTLPHNDMHQFNLHYFLKYLFSVGNQSQILLSDPRSFSRWPDNPTLLMLWALNLHKFMSAHYSFVLLFFLERAELSSLEILSVIHGCLQTTWYRSHGTYLCWLIILCQWWMKIRCHFWFFWMCQLPPVLLTMNWPALWQSGSKDK